MNSNMRIILFMMMLNVIGGIFLAFGESVGALVVFGIAMIGLIVAAVRSAAPRNNE
jgi:hypothetical protein